MNILAIDIGGTHIKILATGQNERQEFESGPKLTPQSMAASVKTLAKDWNYELVSIGYPGLVRFNRPIAEPRNLAKGWVGFNFEGAFGRPVRIINDAAMQALGSYRGGTMLFLGLRNRTWLGHGCGRRCRSVRVGTTFLQEGNLRRLFGTARITATRQEEMAARGRVLHRPPRPRPSPG